MKTWKKISIAFLALLLLLSLLVFYINTNLVPVKLKAILINNLSESFDRDVDIGSLKFSLTKGFVLDNISIYGELGKNNEPFLKADKLTFGIMILPSFRRLNIVIPRVSVESPSFNIKRDEGGEWNIESFLDEKDATEGKLKKISISVKSISFNKGELSFKDNLDGKDFQKHLKDLKGSIGLSLPTALTINLNGNLDQSSINISSKYNLIKKDLVLNLNAKSLSLTEYWDRYITSLVDEDRLSDNSENESLLKDSKFISGECDISLKSNITALKKIKADIGIDMKGLKLGIANTVFSGDYNLSGHTDLNIENLKNAKYNLKLLLSSSKIHTSLKSLDDIEDIEGTIFLSEKEWSFKELGCIIYGSPARLSGKVKAPHKDFTVDLSLSSALSLKELGNMVNIDFKGGKARIDTKIRCNKKGDCEISGTADIEELILTQKDITIKGDFDIQGECSGKIDDWESLEYKGTMDFDSATIKGEGLFPLISNAIGRAEFNTNQIIIKELRGRVADSDILLKTDISYRAKKPRFKATMKSDNLSFGKLLSSLPDAMRDRLKDIDVSGNCSLNLNLAGIANKPATYEYTGDITLKDSNVKLPFWPNEISEVAGEINFNKQIIYWRGFSFTIDGTPYASYGQLSNFENPNVTLNLKSRDLETQSEFSISNNNLINITKLDGKYRNSRFKLGGKLTNRASPYANLQGNIYFDLADSPYLFKAQSDSLKKAKPKGVVKISLDMKGPIQDPSSWILFAEGSSDLISAWGIKFDDFYFDYRMKDKFIDIPVIVAYPYGGIVNINSRANLKTGEQPYIINIDVKDIDLHKFVLESSFEDKKIKGILALKAVLNGYLKQKGSMKGSGWLQVSDGYLWEFPVLHGIMDLILMVPPEYVTLTDAFGNFNINKNRIYTEDFKMLSKTASLLWVGSLGFDTTLDFNITGRFAEDIIKQKTEPGKIASAILREAGNLIMEIRLTGTLAKPTYTVVPFPLKRIFKEKVVDTFRDLFGNNSQ